MARTDSLRLLTRFFVRRFFDTEVLGPSVDGRLLFIALSTLLAAPGVAVPLLMAGALNPADPTDASGWGWAMVARELGPDALRSISLSVKAQYIAYTMGVAALFCALGWRRLVPDRRDALILGAAPAPPSTVLLARVLAMVIVTGLFAAGVHALSALAFGTALAAESGMLFLLRGVLAHLAVTSAASLFVVLAIVAATGVLLAVVGPRRFDSSLGVLQAVVAGAALSLLMALPALDSTAAVRHLIETPAAAVLVPPMWFLGLYESILGSPAAGLGTLAVVALVAMATALLAAAASYPWSYHRLRAFALAGDSRRAAVRSVLAGHLRRAVLAAAQHTRVPAVAVFHLFALGRGPAQRLIVSLAVGATLALVVPAWINGTGGQDANVAFPASAWPLWSLLILVPALRFASAVPADVAGDWLFHLREPWPAAVRQTLVQVLVALGVVPIAVACFATFWAWWGLGIASAHTVVVVMAGVALVEVLVGRSRATPCVGPLQLDGPVLKRRAGSSLAFAFVFVLVMPMTMALASRFPIGLLITTGWWVAIAMTTTAWARRRPALDRGPEAGAIIGSALRADRVTRRTATLRDTSGSAVSEAGSVPDPADRAMFGPRRRRIGRDDRWSDLMDVRLRDVVRDSRAALRRIRRAPGFAVFGVVILAIGIGSTVAAHHVLDQMIGQRSVIDDPDSVFVIESRTLGSLSLADFEHLRDQQTAFSGVGAWSEFPASMAWTDGAALVQAHLVDGGFFSVLGVQSAAGRLIQPADDDSASPPVAVIAHEFWRTSLGARSDVVGSAVTIGRRRYDVVGIAPPTFVGLRTGPRRPDVFVPLAHPPATDAALEAFRRRPDSRWLHLAGRLANGTTETSARGHLTALSRAFDEERPQAPVRRGSRLISERAFGMTPAARDRGWEDARSVGRTFMLVPLTVLLVTMLNMATLVLSRETRRQGELAIRRALGASRASLIGTTVAEMTMLAAAGAGAALLSASAVVRAAARFVEESIAYRPDVHLDAGLGSTTMMTAAILVVVTVAVAGVLPALRATGNINASLGRDGSRSSTRDWTSQRFLVAAQVAVTVCLLLVAALSVRSVIGMATRDAELDLSHVVAASVPFRLQGLSGSEVHGVVDRVLAEAQASGPIERAAAVTSLPVATSPGDDVRVGVPGRLVNDDDAGTGRALLIGVSASALPLLNLAPGDGRLIDQGDLDSRSDAVLLSEQLGRTLFGGASPVGRAVDIGLALNTVGAIGPEATESRTVVGTVTDVPGADGRPMAIVYAPLTRIESPDVWFIASTLGENQAPATDALRAAIRRIDPTLPTSFVGLGDQLVRLPTLVLRFVAQVATALALVALALSMTGLYAVLTHVVAVRRQELGIRLALGSTPRAIVRLIMADGARPVLVGIGVGIALGGVARLSLQPLLTEAIDAIDLPTTVLAAVPLVAAALLASYLPARRAGRTDPLDALREG